MNKILPTLFLALSVLMPLNLWAQEPYAVLTTDTTIVLSSDSTGVTYGQTLTFYYDDQKEARNGMSVGPFSDDSERWGGHAGEISIVVFDDSFANCTILTSTAYWFFNFNILTSIAGINNLKTDNVMDMGSMFSRCSSLTSLDLSGFNTGNVTNMAGMFYGCSSLMSLDLSGFNTANVMSMSSMFDSCSSLTSLDVSGFNTRNVINMRAMFSGCSSLTDLDISHFNTANVVYMDAMFGYCSSLTNLDVSHFNTANVTDMSWMFSGCSGLASLDVSSFNTANVINMQMMFMDCSSLTNLDVSGFNTPKVMYMDCMFSRCSGLTSLDVSGFNTSNVTSMQSMFSSCTKLTSIYAGDGWTTATVTDSWYMFDDCISLVGGQGTVYDSDYTDYTYAHIDGGISNPGYLTFKDAPERDNLCISLQSVPFNSYTGWGINAQVTGTANCEWVLNEATAVAYGDSNVKDGTDLSSYSKLIVTVTEGTPRFLLNRDEEEGQWSENEDESHLIDNTKGGWSSKYFTQESTTNGVVYTVDLKQILKDKGFVRLHAIKSVWGEQVTVTSMELEQNELTTVYHVDYSTYSGYPFMVMDYVPEWNSGVMTDNGAMYKYVPVNNDTGESSDVIVTTNDGTQYYKIALSEPLWHHYFIADSIPTEGGGDYIVKAMVRASEPCTFYVNMAWSWDNEQHVDTPISIGTEWQEIVWRHNGIGGNSCFILAQVGSQTANIEWRWLTVYKEQAETADSLEAYVVRTDNLVFDAETGEAIQTLTFYYDTNKKSFIGVENITVYPISDGGITHVWSPWCPNCQRVEFNESFALYQPISTASWFDGMENLATIYGIENLNTNAVTDMNSMFLGCKKLTSIDVSHFNTANVTSMELMFFSCSSLTSLDLSNFNTANVTNMKDVFAGCNGLTSLDLSNFNTANVSNMFSMFSGCSSLTRLDLSSFNTSNVTNMSRMFSGCSSLTSLDVSSFNTANVLDMNCMFFDCSGLTSLDLSSFNTANVTDMSAMFSICSGLTSLDLSNFNTANVTNMNNMFSGCSSLTSLDLSSFNTDKVTNMGDMFWECISLKTIYAGSEWSTASVEDGSRMFKGCTFLVGAQGTVYDVNHIDYPYARLDGGPDAPGYFSRRLSKGDANGDGEVNIADAVITVTSILGQPTDMYFHQDMADMNDDNVIDIFDVTMIVNAAFDAASPAPAMTRGSASNIMMENVSMTVNADDIYLGVDQPERFTAMQFDVTLPEGTELLHVRLASATTDHQLSFVKRGENEYRVIGLSLSNATFRSLDGQLIKLEVSGSAVGSDVKMSNVLFVKPSGKTVTGIEAVQRSTFNVQLSTCYDLKGQKLVKGKQQLGKGIYIENGRKVIIK